MFRVTFAPALKSRKTGALYVDGMYDCILPYNSSAVMWVDLCAEEVPSVSFPRSPTVSMLIAVILGGRGQRQWAPSVKRG